MAESSHSLQNLTVLIAGAGIGGVSAAIAFRRKGAAVTLFEQTPELAEIGAGLQVQPSATRVINRFGLRDQLAAIGRVPDSMTLREAKTGRVIIPAAALIEQHSDAPHYQVHRADLHAMLYQHARALGVDVELNAAATDTRQENNAATLILSDGREFKGDIVIGADGVKSAIRQSLFGRDAPVFTGNVAYRMMVDASKISKHIEPCAILGPDSHVVIYPLRDGEIINVIAQQCSDSWTEESWTTPADINELKAFYTGWDTAIDALLDNAAEIYKWALYTRPPMQAWSKGNRVLLGDASHPTLPNLGAGAAMAIEDAYVLADLVEKYRQDLPLALSKLHDLRIKRCTRIQEGSKKNAAFFHIANPIERFVKYGAVSLVARWLPNVIHQRLAWLRQYDATTEVRRIS